MSNQLHRVRKRKKDDSMHKPLSSGLSSQTQSKVSTNLCWNERTKQVAQWQESQVKENVYYLTAQPLTAWRNAGKKWLCCCLWKTICRLTVLSLPSASQKGTVPLARVGDIFHLMHGFNHNLIHKKSLRRMLHGSLLLTFSMFGMQTTWNEMLSEQSVFDWMNSLERKASL